VSAEGEEDNHEKETMERTRECGRNEERYTKYFLLPLKVCFIGSLFSVLFFFPKRCWFELDFFRSVLKGYNMERTGPYLLIVSPF